jgi:hypothetical protein
MVKLQLVSTNVRPNTNLAHRASASEGEAAKRLLESQGFIIKKVTNGQVETRCPFHEGPGAIEARKATSFYMNAENSKYFCQSASCQQRGNLQTLERFFGIDTGDDDYVATFKSRETSLREYERALVKALRTPFYEHGLTDETIERFRLGFQAAHTETKVDDAGKETSVQIPGPLRDPLPGGASAEVLPLLLPERRPQVEVHLGGGGGHAVQCPGRRG